MELWDYERQAWSAGAETVCGVDEAGAGPLMGPVYAAAVILPRELEIPGLDDSKKLTEKKREALYERITAEAAAWSVARVEAAEIDGCGSLRFFFTMALPLSKALTAVMVLFYAVSHWNAFFNALLYLDKSSMHPLQLVLRDLLLVNQGVDSSMMADAKEMQLRQKLADLLKYGAVVVSTLPVLCIYPFIQKYFVKGVMVGAVKG